MPEITNNSVLNIESTIPEDDRETMIKVENVGMTFNMASEQLNSLKEYAIALFKKNLFFKELRALDNISFEIKKGDVYGILGTNGSGKSTLLKIVAGVLEPTDGKVTINGSIAPLIELGAGFDMELTARENIYLNGALMGYTKDFINEHFDDIVEFAEIDKFLDMPMKNYSSGMVARIAFAIATVIVPEILIVDEVLSVGDFMFQKKCEDRIQKLIKDHGTTVLLVSHSIEQIERMCNKAIWIEKGKTRINGLAEDVCSIYSLIGGRTGSIEAENTIIEAHLKTKDIKLDNVEDYYYDAGEPSYCDTSLDLVKRATPKGIKFENVILVSPFEHTYLALANSVAGTLDCPVLVYNMNNPDLALISWLEHNEPSNIYVFDRQGCEGTTKLTHNEFGWNPRIKLFSSKSNESQLQWQLNVLDYFLSNDVQFAKEIAIVNYEDNIVATTSASNRSFKEKMPIISFRNDTDNIDELYTWLNNRDFTEVNLINKPTSPQTEERLDKNINNNIFLKPCIINSSEMYNIVPSSEVVIVPKGREIFQLYTPLAYYCDKKNAEIVLVDNTNLDSISSACNIISAQKIEKITFIQGNLRLTPYIVGLYSKCIKLQP